MALAGAFFDTLAIEALQRQHIDLANLLEPRLYDRDELGRLVCAVVPPLGRRWFGLQSKAQIRPVDRCCQF